MAQQSVWYLVGAAFGAQLQAVATAQAVDFLENPALPVDPNQFKQRALFYVHRGDKSIDQPGQRNEKRTMRLVVGAIAAGPQDTLAEADALHFAARTALRGEPLRAALAAIERIGRIVEVEVEPALRETQVAGTVLLSAFEVEYFQKYPNAA